MNVPRFPDVVLPTANEGWGFHWTLAHTCVKTSETETITKEPLADG